MANVDYSQLNAIIKNPNSENKNACDGSVCLNQFMNVLINFIEKGKSYKELDLALLTRSLQQFMFRKTFTTCNNTIFLGDIFNVDFGMNYEPEIGYNHPALVLEIVGDLILVAPTSTSEQKINDAYHPIDNPTSSWYYYKVGIEEGFAETCALILGNIRIVSQGRLLEKKGKLTENINNDDSLFRKIKHMILKGLFPKEIINLENEIESVKLENIKLKQKIERLEKEKLELSYISIDN